ncbi:hypothetical protein AB0M39_16970 [Streptomyces sp. NPDC051907]|uniref:hypothetical protein n=1 Tax=Streptomyces sp. NPDC051907 TaxID=3155284 RepID=UPI00341AA22B
MAEDNGVAAAASLGALGMLPFVGGAVAAAKMVTEMESMSTFKKEIDKILLELEGSEAAPDKVSADRLEPGHLGKPEFRESAFLYGTYMVVHDELEKLSKILAQQIDGLSIAVQASQVGYENIDDDIRRRMLRFADEMDQYGQQAQQSVDKHAGGSGGSQSGAGSINT